ncbi:polyphenol oxidase family protein [Pseudomonas chlororaphis]|uniref:polyphenol oxidase family protein n=1 Tax=Pseudomonas chlororaphis TaxID=587753 RepID=UPI001CF4F68B|nr:polyphenol oxidase family protein [Pseudomonas chlororaphis]UCR82755.1 polyphenol oxidase family protein [Pseudomonas chlororaphis]
MSFQAPVLKQIPGIRHEFSRIGAPLPANLFFCSQAHTGEVVEASTTLPSGIIRGDAVFTRTGRPIAVITADCLPLLISSEDASWVAAVHAGWKGLHGGIIDNVLQRFAAKGIAAHQLRVAFGPSIKPCCYEVSPEFIDTLSATQGHLWSQEQAPWSQKRPAPRLPPEIAPPPPTRPDSLWFDLSGYALNLLRVAGISDKQIEHCEHCTYCSSPTLASYRRRGHRGEEKSFQYSWIGRA